MCILSHSVLMYCVVFCILFLLLHHNEYQSYGCTCAYWWCYSCGVVSSHYDSVLSTQRCETVSGISGSVEENGDHFTKEEDGVRLYRDCDGSQITTLSKC